VAAAFPCAFGLVPAAAAARVAAGLLALAWAVPAAAQPVDPVTVVARPLHACPASRTGPDYACLNAHLAATARGAQPQPGPRAADVLGDGAPDRVGVFSYSGLAEQLGANFGKSAFPQRPPRPTFYAPPLSPPPVPRPR
jgi:hypothetical protein